MIRSTLAAATFAAVAGLATAAAAQSSAPIPRNGGTVELGRGTPVETGGTGLPGVGLDASTSSRSGSPRGPGGLSNGVGAYGVMAPDASGTAGNTLTRVPGAIPETNSGIGIPLGREG
ncbi:hypothetical protein [Aureimonas sp. AU12]|uniref:hypothetical protein n=1 Tax=Aureimonas sp. AU12 TaxID=1638161 RepID=UPI0007840E38|nr:hypothetical protein [Aureimonas sp. AU12]